MSYAPRRSPEAAAELCSQLARRREASRRLEPIHDHDQRSDPLDKPRPHPVVTVRAIGRNTVEFSGCGGAVAQAMRTLSTRRMRARNGGAWLVPQTDSDDLMALLEVRGYTLDFAL